MKQNFLQDRDVILKSIKLLQSQIEATTNQDELLKLGENFSKHFCARANERNNRPRKFVSAWQEWAKLTAPKQRSQEAVLLKAKKKLKSKKSDYKDFKEQILAWRADGKSYPQIVNLLKAKAGIDISDQTIARFLKGLKNDADTTSL